MFWITQPKDLILIILVHESLREFHIMYYKFVYVTFKIYSLYLEKSKKLFSTISGLEHSQQ